jgi:hypothetical protein
VSQYDEYNYSTPSQAEGERLEEDMDMLQRDHRHPLTARTTPSQAEGMRSQDEEDRKG